MCTAMKSRCHCSTLLLLLSNEWNWCMNGNKCSESSSRFQYVSHRYAQQRGSSAPQFAPTIGRRNRETVFNEFIAAFCFVHDTVARRCDPSYMERTCVHKPLHKSMRFRHQFLLHKSSTSRKHVNALSTRRSTTVHCQCNAALLGPCKCLNRLLVSMQSSEIVPKKTPIVTLHWLLL